MDLKEWAKEYLQRNSKIKQWKIISLDDNGALVQTSRAKTFYEFQEDLSKGISSSKEERIIITLNTKKNIKEAQGFFDSLDNKTRILFANTDTDSFWILNPHFIRNYSSPEQFKKNPASFVGETTYM